MAYKTAAKTPSHNQHITRPTPLVVRLLSARCPVVVQSMTGQQLDNNWTTTGQRTVLMAQKYVSETMLRRGKRRAESGKRRTGVIFVIC